jgi:hypothetical protein
MISSIVLEFIVSLGYESPIRSVSNCSLKNDCLFGIFAPQWVDGDHFLSVFDQTYYIIVRLSSQKVHDISECVMTTSSARGFLVIIMGEIKTLLNTLVCNWNRQLALQVNFHCSIQDLKRSIWLMMTMQLVSLSKVFFILLWDVFERHNTLDFSLNLNYYWLQRFFIEFYHVFLDNRWNGYACSSNHTTGWVCATEICTRVLFVWFLDFCKSFPHPINKTFGFRLGTIIASHLATETTWECISCTVTTTAITSVPARTTTTITISSRV